MKNDLPKGPLEIELYLSHTHWDHIMGFPIFLPRYIFPEQKLNVYGPVTFEEDPLEDVVGGQMKYRYFPVNVGELASNIGYFRLKEDPFIDLGDGFKLATKILNHPITALGYRFEYKGKVLCTCYDTEPFRNLFITDPEDPEYDEAMAYEGGLVAEEQKQGDRAVFSMERICSSMIPSTLRMSISVTGSAGDTLRLNMQLRLPTGLR